MIKIKLILSFLFLVQGLAIGADIFAPDQRYFAPLGNERRADYHNLKNRIIGLYGENRNSYVQGHKHSGIDIKGCFNETVHPIGNGIVIDIFRDFPHKTIYIQHHKSEDILFYSVYIHVEDIQVNVGDYVSENSPIARIFNNEELALADFGKPPHLHFEIRHNIDDRGEATFKSMNITDLNEYCIDPLKFFEKSLINLQKNKFY